MVLLSCFINPNTLILAYIKMGSKNQVKINKLGRTKARLQHYFMLLSKSMKSIITYIKTHYILSAVAVIAIIAIGAGIYVSGAGSNHVTTVTAKRGNVVQTVAVSGRVKPASSVELAFEGSGRVATISAKVGDRVTKDTTLVVLDSADLYADLAQAQAQLQREQIKLADLQSGTRPEDIAIYQTSFDNAKTSLTQTNQTAFSVVRDVASKVDSAIHYRVDSFFVNPRSFNPYVVFRSQSNDSLLLADVQKERVAIEDMLKQWNKNLGTVYPNENLTQNFAEATANVLSVQNFLNDLSIVVNNLSVGGDLEQSELDAYKSAMAAARAELSTAITDLNTAEQNLKNAQSAVASAERQLTLKMSGYTARDIAAQETQVLQQQGIVDARRAAIAKNIIKAPISGIISLQDAKVGQIAPAGTVIVSIVSDAQFEVEANVPEADISKIAVGNPTQVTLDAYGTRAVFDATVVTIDPTAIVIDGVPTYKLTLQFNTADTRIRSGMTANLQITAATATDVITIPQRVITTTDAGSTVQVQENGVVVTKTIETGLRGSDGVVEVVSGLSEGDVLIVPTS